MVDHPMLLTTIYMYIVADLANANCAMIREFKVLDAPPGSKLCAFDASSDTMSLNSALECALECQRFWYCENFNYNNMSNKCDIFYNRPICFGPSSSCIHYQVMYSKRCLLSIGNSGYIPEMWDIQSIINNNNNLRVSNIRVSNRTLIYNVCPNMTF